MLRLTAILVTALCIFTTAVHAETDRIRVGQQYGLPYAQLVLYAFSSFAIPE